MVRFALAPIVGAANATVPLYPPTGGIGAAVPAAGTGTIVATGAGVGVGVAIGAADGVGVGFVGRIPLLFEDPPPPPPPHAVTVAAARTANPHVPTRKNIRVFKPAFVILESPIPKAAQQSNRS